MAALSVSSRRYQVAHQASLRYEKASQFGHLIQAEVAGLSEYRRVEMGNQIPGARLGAAGVLE